MNREDLCKADILLCQVVSMLVEVEHFLRDTDLDVVDLRCELDMVKTEVYTMLYPDWGKKL